MTEVKRHTNKHGVTRHIPVKYNKSGERSETIAVSLPKSRVARIRELAEEQGHSISKVVNDRLSLEEK